MIPANLRTPELHRGDLPAEDMLRPRRPSAGQSMVEFIIITPVMLLLIFGTLQFAFLYQAKTALNYATFQTAREGAVNNAHMAIMEYAFARNMAAIYTHNDTVDELKQARDRIRNEIADGFVRIDVLNPTADMFNSFGVDDGSGDRFIPNDNLMYRPLDQDSASGVSVQDANLLKIRITYCYPMYVPYVNRVFAITLTQSLDPVDCPGCSGAFSTSGTFERQCLDRGRFPLNAQAIVRMQSPARESGVLASSAGAGTGTGGIAKTAFQQSGVRGTASPGALTTPTGIWTLDVTGRPAGP